MTENLISLLDRPKDERKEIARSGGIASGKARRENADVVRILKKLLETRSKDYGIDATGAEVIAVRLFQLAINENSLPAIKEILDRVYGRPHLSIETTIAEDKREIPVGTGAFYEHINNLAKAKAAEMLEARGIDPGILDDEPEGSGAEHQGK